MKAFAYALGLALPHAASRNFAILASVRTSHIMEIEYIDGFGDIMEIEYI